MSSTPAISILMPVFNAAPFLQECLDSILDQTEKNWELIAVDDFSIDDSLFILEKYAAQDKRIQVFKNNKKGIIGALRLALSKSQGTFITRMDADDIMPLQKLGKLKSISQHHGPGHLATGKVKYFAEGALGDGYRKYERWLNELVDRSCHFDEIYKECVIPSPCWMMTKEDLERCGAFDPDTYPEDYDLCFRFYKNDLKVIASPDVLHLWRDHSSRISRNHEHYAVQHYFDLKLPYFLELDYNKDRPLVIWGAGKKGKRLAKMLVGKSISFHWVCDSPNKIGKDIYGQKMAHFESLLKLEHPQIIATVAAPEGQEEIKAFLKKYYFRAGSDYYFFV